MIAMFFSQLVIAASAIVGQMIWQSYVAHGTVVVISFIFVCIITELIQERFFPGRSASLVVAGAFLTTMSAIALIVGEAFLKGVFSSPWTAGLCMYVSACGLISFFFAIVMMREEMRTVPLLMSVVGALVGIAGVRNGLWHCFWGSALAFLVMIGIAAIRPDCLKQPIRTMKAGTLAKQTVPMSGFFPLRSRRNVH